MNPSTSFAQSSCRSTEKYSGVNRKTVPVLSGSPACWCFLLFSSSRLFVSGVQSTLPRFITLNQKVHVLLSGYAVWSVARPHGNELLRKCAERSWIFFFSAPPADYVACSPRSLRMHLPQSKNALSFSRLSQAARRIAWRKKKNPKTTEAQNILTSKQTSNISKYGLMSCLNALRALFNDSDLRLSSWMLPLRVENFFLLSCQIIILLGQLPSDFPQQSPKR